jgi:hypothetical protein
MSNQDQMAIADKMRERVASMLGAAVEEAAILDVVVETLQTEVQALRSATEMLTEQASQARSLLQTELEQSEAARELLGLAYALLHAIPRSRWSKHWAQVYIQWFDGYQDFLGHPPPLAPELPKALPQSSKGLSALTTSPDE